MTKGLLFETFLTTVWYKLYRCDIGVEMILTTNESVDVIRNFKSNAFRVKKILYETNTQQTIFYETKCAAGKTYQIKCAVGQISCVSPKGYSFLLI